jgi:anti-sigma B factor antagonist
MPVLSRERHRYARESGDGVQPLALPYVRSNLDTREPRRLLQSAILVRSIEALARLAGGRPGAASPFPARTCIFLGHRKRYMRTAMRMTERVVGGVTILDLTGTITIDQDAGRLKDKINSLIQQARTSVVLNLAGVSYIDSGGLGQLVASYASLANTAGGLKLLHLTKRNHDLLSITRLATLFQTFETEDEAVRSFEAVPLGRSLPLR